MSTDIIRGRSATAILIDWRDAMPQEEWEAIAEQIAQFIVKKALGCDLGFFRLLIDLVDGPVVRKAEDDLTTATDCTVILLEDERTPEMVKAA